jgi:hypothetical protein
MHATLLTLLLGGSQLVQAAVAGPRLAKRDGASPSMPHDEKATEYCTWWIDYTETMACDTILQNNQISITQFKRWVSLMITCITCAGANTSFPVESFCQGRLQGHDCWPIVLRRGRVRASAAGAGTGARDKACDVKRT